MEVVAVDHAELDTNHAKLDAKAHAAPVVTAKDR